MAFLGRLWQSAAGLATLFFVVRYFSPTIQGYFQTFLSLIALQAFFELGLLGVIVVVISHEWAGLELLPGQHIAGDEEKRRRLASAARFVARWFAAASMLLLLAGGFVGAYILRQHGSTELWLYPWMTSIALAAALLFCQSLVAVLEGANRVLEVAIYRLIQASISAVALWTAAALGSGLWSLVAQLSVALACAIVFTGYVYRRFFRQLLKGGTTSTFDWRIDIWPMQWQLALQGVAGYFGAALLVPVMFSYYGPVEAGRMGLSLQVAQAMLALATSWLTVALPRLGTAFASGQYARFESHWLRASAASLSLLALAALAVIGLVVLANLEGIPAAQRFLSPLPFALLVLWTLTIHVGQCLTAYWRTQRVELLRLWGILPGTAMGLAVWLSGKRYGATGAAAGAFGAAALVMLPLCAFLFNQSRVGVKSRRMASASIEKQKSGS